MEDMAVAVGTLVGEAFDTFVVIDFKVSSFFTVGNI